MKRAHHWWVEGRHVTAGLLLLGLCLIPTASLPAQEVVIVDFGKETEGVPKGWELSEKSGKADLALVQDQIGQVLRLLSNSASFSIQRKVEIDLKRTPILAWQWKVTGLPKGGDFRQGSTDDQAAQLIVAFSSTKFITYIWDTTAPKGTMADAPSPPFRTVKAVVVQSGEREKGKWVSEARNVVEDYKKLFGADPEKIVGIRIQINSQHTKSRAESYWGPVVIKAHP